MQAGLSLLTCSQPLEDRFSNDVAEFKLEYFTIISFHRTRNIIINSIPT